MDNVQQLEKDKAFLEERVTQLAGEETSRGCVRAELEESKKEVCRLWQAVAEHTEGAKQVNSMGLMCWISVIFYPTFDEKLKTR